MDTPATTILDLARRPDGYLVALGEDIISLREAGLVTITLVGGGFVIVRAVPEPIATPPQRTHGGRFAKGWRTIEGRACA